MRRPWDRGEQDGSGPGDAGWISGYGGRQSDQEEEENGERESDSRPDSGTSGERERSRRSGADTTGEYRFSKLREDAFDRFMANSAQLRAAHFAPEKPYLRERMAWVLRWVLWVLACGLAPMPAPLNTRLPRTEASTALTEAAGRQAIPAQTGPAPRRQPSSTRADQPSSTGPAEHTADAADASATSKAAMPGAALAAAINGARTARKVIADRGTRTSTDLAAAVRNSALGSNRASLAEPAAAHWRTQPRQNRPRPSPRQKPASYMTVWEQAFDTSTTIIRVTGEGIGAAA